MDVNRRTLAGIVPVMLAWKAGLMGVAPDSGSKMSQFLRLAFFRSPNYVAGSTGWTINQDGSAEFNNVTVRGTVTSGHFVGTGEGTEVLIYSGAPAAGNLVASITSAAFTDSFGNIGLAGITEYSNVATQLNPAVNGGMFIYTGSLAAGWVAVASVALGAGGTLRLADVNGITLASPVTATGGSAGSPTLITTDTWNAMTPLANGWQNTGGNVTAQYRLLPTNEVAIIGAILATTATSTTFFTLPAGYRPASQQQIPCGATGGQVAGSTPFIQCTTGGVLSLQHGTIGAADTYPFHGTISLDA